MEHQPCFATTNESRRPCQPPHALGTSQVRPSTRSAPSDSQSHSPAANVLKGATQQELHQKPASQESRESPLNGNTEESVRSSKRKSVDKGKGSKFIYPADKAFDKRVFKHVAKPFKQYKHGLKKDYFKPEDKTKEDMYDIVPKGQCRDRWMRLVDYWCSTQHETLAEIGRDARASQTHCHTTGSTNYVEKRADFVGTHGREPSHLEFFKETHSKEGGGFIANTATEGFLNEASAKVQERLLSSSPSKTQAVCNGKITNEFLDATEATLHMAGDQVQEESTGNDLSNGLRHTVLSTSTSRVN
ncbi:hypothetical protein Cgig2_026194 [Carnegiea gigantea]|uniref:Uncharacterized protein n=1 Tax=Carnegiea gigantea TaxID=171969 RepID=A0A9Q1GLZ5_9CARY|nr:hypothetical protein Cgig2_026194 [Carnegiea gigantea]